MESLISKLKSLELDEKTIKGLKSELIIRLNALDKQLDEISKKRSLALRELELVYSSDQSENDYQSLCSDYSIYPKSSDLDSDEYSQKRKKSRSDSTASDVETKKVKSSDTGLGLSGRLNSVDDINRLDQQMVNKCIDEMANKAIKEISGSDLKLKDEFEKLSEDPLFGSLVKEVAKNSQKDIVENSGKHCMTQTTPRLAKQSPICRSQSTDGNFKENIPPPSGRVKRSASNRFKFDQQNDAINVSSRVLKGKKLLSNLLAEKQIIDEKREKFFTEKVEITSKDFKQNFNFWEKKATECLIHNKFGSKPIVSV